jgi:hypothetical protein
MHELDAAVIHAVIGVLVRVFHWQVTRADQLINGIL